MTVMVEEKKGNRFDRAFKPYRRDMAKPFSPFDIEVDPTWNVRDMSSVKTLEHIANLKESIKVRGVERPIKVKYFQKEERLKLVDGLCRLTAVRELWNEGLTGIDIPMEEAKGDEAELQIQAITANSGEPFTQAEFGFAVKRLIGWGRTIEEIASHTAKSKKYVTESVQLADAPLEVKKLVAEGAVTAGEARRVVRELGEGAAGALRAKADARTDKSKPVKREKEDGSAQKALKLADRLVLKLLEADEVYDEGIEQLAEDYAQLRGIVNRPVGEKA